MAGIGDFLAQLDNPALFKKVTGVPVFRPHERTLPAVKDKGWPEIKIEVTPADLAEIAKRTNDAGPQVMTEGHRNLDPAFPEKDQPRKVGWEINHRPGQYVFVPGGKPEPCILADLCYDAGLYREVGPAVYPFRSADYDFQNKRLSGLAVLIRRPFLELGMVPYQSYSRQIVQYAMETPTMAEPGATNTETPEWTPEEEVQYAKICKYMAKKHPRLGAYMDGITGEKVSDDTTPVGKDGDGAISQMKGGPKPGSDGFKAMKAKEDPDYPWYDDPDYAANQRVAQYFDAPMRIAFLESESLLDTIKDKVRFKRSREVPFLMRLRADQRPAHVQYMLTTYEKLPAPGMIPVARGNVEPVESKRPPSSDGKTLTQKQMNAALRRTDAPEMIAQYADPVSRFAAAREWALVNEPA